MSVERNRVSNVSSKGTVQGGERREAGDLLSPTVSSVPLSARPWAGDWRLEDARADREAELYYARSRSTEDYD